MVFQKPRLCIEKHQQPNQKKRNKADRVVTNFQSLIFLSCWITKYMEIATANRVQIGKKIFSVSKWASNHLPPHTPK